MAWDVDYRKPPMLLCMGLKIRLDEDLYGLLAGVHLHSDRCVAKIYLMATTVLASNNRVRHFLPQNMLLALHLGKQAFARASVACIEASPFL
jgi:hypothetical protein